MKRHILEQNYPRLLASAGIDAEQVLRKAGVAEDTFPHRSTGYTVIGRGPRPAKVAL